MYLWCRILLPLSSGCTLPILLHCERRVSCKITFVSATCITYDSGCWMKPRTFIRVSCWKYLPHSCLQQGHVKWPLSTSKKSHNFPGQFLSKIFLFLQLSCCSWDLWVISKFFPCDSDAGWCAAVLQMQAGPACGLWGRLRILPPHCHRWPHVKYFLFFLAH